MLPSLVIAISEVPAPMSTRARLSILRSLGIDTFIAAKYLGLGHISLANLIKCYFNLEVTKKYQKSDWSKRPLSDEKLHAPFIHRK